MQCPECQFDNPEEAVFCCKCGTKFESLCHGCGYQNPPESSFCCKCGSSLSSMDVPADDNESAAQGRQAVLETGTDPTVYEAPDSERRCVTVMFSDLTGYTEMSERLDPEEVKEITSTIFSKLTQIIEKYDGFIEKYIGDAILAVFGAKEAFEDSALRAIKAAREIHTYVATIGPKYNNIIGRELSMHTGINTGLVVTGEINYQKGTHGLVGDTINTAARLMSASQAGEIITDRDTFIQTKGYFEFDHLEPVTVKGKVEPIQLYRVGGALQVPQKLHRLHGRRADLIGRSIEMQVLEDAAENLDQGQGAVVAVCGTAGTGKSRLVHEFKKNIDLEQIQWFDANAYPYTQNTPYYPLVDLLTKAFGIEEADTADTIKLRVESGLKGFLGKESKLIPFIGGLFSIEYPETSEVSPEYWKNQLFTAVRDVLMALTSSKPTIICLEDLHWADPSFLEMIRYLITETTGSVLFICIYRPIISLFTGLETQSLEFGFKDLRLRELSPSETQVMVGSLLKSDKVPRDLQRFVHENVEGNPFYVEELINSLIDSGILSNKSGEWEIAKAINESDISTNIQGVLAGRIDRLGPEAKRILQEASVIGRAFLYDILRRISDTAGDIDKNISILERLDLISARSIHPTLEYIFKHALTQEIVYNGLVKSERKSIHEKIGQVIEALFADRLSEFYESLAFHYTRGKSVLKALEYLLKAGKKCLRRFSLKESDRYFQNARDILEDIEKKTNAENEMIIDLLNEWAMVFYYKGAFADLEELLRRHAKVAASITNKKKQGIFQTWQGMVYWQKSEFLKARDYLVGALESGEKNNLDLVVVHACAWLSWLYGNLGSFEKGIECGHRGNRLAIAIKADHFFIYKPLAGVAFNLYLNGEAAACIDMGRALVEYGKRHSQVRCQTLGYVAEGIGYMAAGDFSNAIASMETADKVSIDTFYNHYSQSFLVWSKVIGGHMQDAEPLIAPLTEFFKPNGSLMINDVLLLLEGIILIDKGDIKKGMAIVNNQLQLQREKGQKGLVPVIFLTIGMVYLEIIKGEKPIAPMTVIKNIGFILQNVPQAANKAINHYRHAIETAQEVGALGIVGQAHRDIGKIHALKKRYQLAEEHFEEALHIFEKVGAYGFAEQVRNEIAEVESAAST